MSADNWTKCPRCKVNAEKEQEKKAEKVGQSYGKVSPEEYLRLVKDAGKAIELKDDLREDYELHTSEDGEFYVSYSCHCSHCGFRHTFKHTEKLDLNKGK